MLNVNNIDRMIPNGMISGMTKGHTKAPFTLVLFRLKRMTFATVMPIVYSTVSFFEGWKRRLLKTMAWLPTFALRILDDLVNNNIMLITVPIDMYG